MLIASQRQTRTNRLLAVFCGVSFVAHLAAVGVYAVVSMGADPAIKLDKQVVKTRLVKLGKKRDEKLLPRIDKSRPKPKTDKGPKRPADPKEKKPADEPEDKPSAKDILEKFSEDNEESDLDSLIQDKIGEPLDEGDPDGHKLGTDITGRLKADYNDLLLAKIKNAYKLPQTLTDEERVRLRAVLFIAIGPDGALLKADLDPGSGNSSFDSAVLAAAKKAAPLPPPPIPVREFYAQGVGFNFCPISCK